MKIKIKGILLMILSSIVYFTVMASGYKTALSYFIVLSILSLTIILINKDSLVCANNLFLIFFVYAVGLGPVFLLHKGINYDFGFFETILGALLAFGWGNAVALIKQRQTSPVEDRLKVQIINFSRKDILIICYLISLIFSIYFLVSNKEYLLSGDLNANRIAAQSGNGLILHISQLPVVIVPMMYDLYHKEKAEGRNFISTKYYLITMMIISSVTLLFSGFRAPVVTMYICLAVLFIQKNKIKSSKVIAIGIVFVVAVEVMGYMRSSLSNSTSSISTFMDSFSTTFVVNCYNLKYIFDAFPSRIPFQNGYTYLINLLMLLPGPDQDFTLWLKDQLNLSYAGGGVTPTIIGELYINFGRIGIYVGMFLIGILGVQVNKYFKKHSITFMGAFYVWQFAHCASGGIANVIVTVLLYTIVYWGVMLFPINKRSRIDINRNLVRNKS